LEEIDYKSEVMKFPPSYSPAWAALAGISLVTPAFAVVNIEYVTVGNAGNVADPATGSIFGAVAYAYKIAKNETTVSDYTQFLNAVAATDTYGLYSTQMTTSYNAGITRSGSPSTFTYSVVPGSGNKPITFVSWFDAARFTNWMNNGQPTGAQNAATTEDGAYTLNGATSGVSVSKNVGATVWIPSENEWYKAAYYDPTKSGVGGYWLYANQNDSLVSNTIGVAHAANYYHDNYAASGSPSFPTSNALTDVGAYGENSDSYYGTNDQLGNVRELNDAIIGTERGARGGSWASNIGLETDMPATTLLRSLPPQFESADVGFRLASIPEPTSLVITMLAGGVMLIRRKR